MAASVRLVVGAIAAGLLVATAGAVPAEAATAAAASFSIVLPARAVLTLPAGDGFRDSVAATVVAPSAAPVDVVAIRGTHRVPVASGVVPATAPVGAHTVVPVAVQDLSVGTWRIEAVQGGSTTVASGALMVGSGVPKAVSLRLQRHTVYPKAGGTASELAARLVARDETGTSLPVSARVTLARSAARRTARTPRAEVAPVVLVPAAGLASGTASVTAVLRGPTGIVDRVGPDPVRLADTVLTRTSVALSSPVVEPVVDDRLDSVRITASGLSDAGASVPVRGRIALLRSGHVVRAWSLTSSAKRTVVWDGRVGGRIVAGDYSVQVSERGPSGAARSATASLRVSTAHLAWRARTVAPLGVGNLQGIAIGSPSAAPGLWTTVASADGSAQIREYDLSGHAVAQSPALPLGHAAGIAVDADGTLAVVNGGPTTPTVIRIVDPSTWTIVRELDLGALGPNGLLATRADGWEVFAGTAGSFTLTSVASSGAAGTSVPISVTGVPQGLVAVHGEVWLYTSLSSGNLITRFDPATGRELGRIELALPGEGEGMALDPSSSLVYVGCHTPDRFAVLERVPAA